MGGRSKRQGAQGSCRPLRTATSIHKNSPSQLSRKWADVSWQWLTLETTMQKGSIWRSLKEGQNTNKIFRNIAWPHKNYVRKTKAHWELIFVKDIKDNMKNFSHPINSKMVNSEDIYCWMRPVIQWQQVQTGPRYPVLHSSLNRSPFPPGLVNEFKDENCHMQVRINKDYLRGLDPWSPLGYQENQLPPLQGLFLSS